MCVCTGGLHDRPSLVPFWTPPPPPDLPRPHPPCPFAGVLDMVQSLEGVPTEVPARGDLPLLSGLRPEVGMVLQDLGDDSDCFSGESEVCWDGGRSANGDAVRGPGGGGEATRTAGTGNQNGRGWESVRMGGSDNKEDGLASQPRRYRVPGQPLLNRHQVWGVSRSPGRLFAQQEREPIRGRPAVRGKGTCGGRPGQRVEEQGTWASRTQNHSEAGYGRPVDRGTWTAKPVKRPPQQPA